jgi:hypothetical protein
VRLPVPAQAEQVPHITRPNQARLIDPEHGPDRLLLHLPIDEQRLERVGLPKTLIAEHAGPTGKHKNFVPPALIASTVSCINVVLPTPALPSTEMTLSRDVSTCRTASRCDSLSQSRFKT